MVRTEHLMGTVISVDWRDVDVDRSEIDAAFNWFSDVNSRFSPFKMTATSRGSAWESKKSPIAALICTKS